MPVRDLAGVAAAVVTAVGVWCGGVSSPLVPVVVGILVAVVVTLGVSTARTLTATEAWLMAALGWSLVSSALADCDLLAAKQALAAWLVAVVILICMRRIDPARGQIARHLLVAVATTVAGWTMAECVVSRQLRVGGPFENPNWTAAVLVAALPLAVTTAPLTWRISSVFTIAVGIIGTGSRAGLLAATAVALLAAPRGRGRRLAGITCLVMACVVVGLRFAQAPDVLAWHRLAIWRGILAMAADHPLVGVGPGGIPEAAVSYRLLHEDHVGQRQFVIGSAESGPLAVVAQLGFAGLLLTAAVVVVGYREVRQRLRPKETRGLQMAAAGIGVMCLFHDFTTADAVLWWWAAAVASLLPRLSPGSQGTGAPRTTSLTLALCAGWFVLWGLAQPSLARYRWATGAGNGAAVRAALRCEPWLAPAAQHRARELLAAARWRWSTAAETHALLEQALDARPRSSSLWADRGRAHLRTVVEIGSWPASVAAGREAFRRATELDPWLPWAWLDAARLERAVGETATARALVGHALAAEPNATAAWLLAARLELDAGRLDEAREALARARATAGLAERPGLSAYERSLVEAPAWQLEELERALR